MPLRMSTEVGWAQAPERIGLVDGSPWIRNELELHGLASHLGLDDFHLRENVRQARLAAS